MRLEYAHGIVSGGSGTTNESESRASVRVIDSNGVAGFVLAEPSAARNTSKSQSELTTEAAAIIAKRFDELYASPEDFINKTVQTLLTKPAKGWRFKPVSTEISLLFVALKGNRYLAGHMGSGLIARWNGGCSVLSMPETGEYRKHLKIYKGDAQGPFGFMLLTEGACHSLYGYESDSLSPACATFFEWLGEYDGETVSEALLENINKYFKKDTKGDIGVALLISDGSEPETEAVVPGAVETDVEMPEAVEPEPEISEVMEPEPEMPEAVETEDVETEPEVPENTESEALAPGDAEPEDIVSESVSEPEHEETSEDEEVLEKEEKGLGKVQVKPDKLVKYLIGVALVVILVIVFIFTMKDPGFGDQRDLDPADNRPPANSLEEQEQEPDLTDNYSSDYEPSVTFAVDNPESYDAGRYKIGVDIPAGEYFFWTGEMLKPNSIIVNDDTCLSDELYCMTVQVNDYDVLETEYRFTAAENVNPIKATKGILLSGKYKIGKDIGPGQYTLKPANEDVAGKYYSILEEEISNRTEITGATVVEVPEEGYIVFYNSVLVVKE